MTPQKFLESIKKDYPLSVGAIIELPSVTEVMRLYAQHVAKEVRHRAAEISLMDDPEYRHRMIMNIQINDNEPHI